jgi:FkbM family methyltransferase
VNFSAAFWSILSQTHSAGLGQFAALIANRAYRNRHFAVDADGHWINQQAEATFASPDPHGLRYDYLAKVVRDVWLYAYSPQPADIVFDVGAGVGEEAVVLSRSVRHVYAVEAHPDTYKCLEKTVNLSGCSNVTPIHCAIGDQDGRLFIDTSKSHLANSVMHGSGQAVPARSLVSLCHDLGVTEIDFLKMNIEGAERLSVRGFGDFPIRNLAIACHDFIPGKAFRTREVVDAFLCEHGYRVQRRESDPRPWIRETLYAAA